MNDTVDDRGHPAADATRNSIEPDEDGVIHEPDRPEALEGEPGIPSVTQPRKRRMSRKAIGALLGSVLGTAVVATLVLSRATANESPDEKKRLASAEPTAAAASPRRLDLGLPHPASAPAPTPSPLVPAIRPTADEAEPIGVRRTGAAGAGAKPMNPEDAPVLLVSSGRAAVPSSTSHTNADPSTAPRSTAADPMAGTRRSLEAYQRQLQGMMDSLGQGASLAGAQGNSSAALGSSLTAAAPSGNTTYTTNPTDGGGLRTGSTSNTGLFGGELAKSATPRVVAGQLGDRNLTLPKGTAFTCALKTRVVSAASGLVGCQVQRNVYSDNGRVLLIERGSHLDGEYRMTTVRPGTVRIPVVWTRIRTPNGVTVDIDSPGTGPLGESGIDGYVDNRWGERIGAAMLLSVIDDAVKLVIQNQSSEGGGNTVILQSTTSNTSKLAEKVLDSTINIPPLIYQHQGGIVGIYVARDVDFSSVYQLEAADRGATP
jgi:type IV secretion system protein VirB10